MDLPSIADSEAGQTESASVAEDIEDPFAGDVPGDRGPILALVEVKTGFMPLLDVDSVAHAVFEETQRPRRLGSAGQPVCQFELFAFANSLFRSQPNSSWPQFGFEQIQDPIAAVGQRQRCELDE